MTESTTELPAASGPAPAPDRPGLVRGLHGQTVEALGARIVQGRYAPGSPLQPDEIEREFGISKTVLREAMRVLAAKGLVDPRQRRGTVVRPRSSWHLLDAVLLRWQSHDADAKFLDNLAEVRSIVEPAGARLAAQRRTDKDLADLDAALTAMVDAGTDTASVVEADVTFHRALLNAAHNELLSQMEVVIGAGLRARDQLVHSRQSWPDSIPVHRAILAAVRSGDPGAARRAMEALLEQASLDAGQERPGEAGRPGPADADGAAGADGAAEADGADGADGAGA